MLCVALCKGMQHLYRQKCVLVRCLTGPTIVSLFSVISRVRTTTFFYQRLWSCVRENENVCVSVCGGEGNEFWGADVRKLR